MKVALTLCAAVVASLAVAGCNCPQKKKSPPAPGETSTAPASTSGGAAAPATECAACAKGAKGESVWCDACAQGFVAGEKVTCKGCYAAKTGGPACATCAAKKT